MDGELAQEKLLLVEGEGDLHVILQVWLAHHRGPDVPFHIQPCGGVANLLERVEAEIDDERRTAVGFAFDANADAAGRRQQLIDRAHRAGYAASQWGASGFIDNRRGGPRIGAWLMPDNERPGELEDFLWTMIRDDDILQPLATDFVANAMQADRRFAETKQRRAEIYSWLAVQEEPYPTGRAVEAKRFDVNAEIAVAFVDWLEKLFTEPS